MRSNRGRPGLSRDGRPCRRLARWLSIAASGCDHGGWFPMALCAADGVAYQAPSVQPTGPASESPLDRAVSELQSSEPSQESPLDRAIRELGAAPETAGAPPAAAPSGPSPALAAAPGGAQLKLIDISLDGLFAAGWSTAPDPELQDLEGGGHDPRKRGFTVRGVELSMMGAVDPYLDGEMHLVSFIDPIQGDTVVELEEAFMTTRSLPHGLQLKAGQFLTEFGRINPTHPHAWAWLDQPIINTRVFGPDGMRAPGVRVELAGARRLVLASVRDDAERQRRADVQLPGQRGVLRGAAHRRPAVCVSATCIPSET